MILSFWKALFRPAGDVRFLALFGVGMVALFLALFFSAQAGLLLLTAAWVAVFTWRFPWTAFLLLVAVAPFLLLLKATVVLGPLTLLKDVVILALFARALRGDASVRHGASWPSSALLVPVFILLVWAMVAFLRADSPVLGLLRLRDLLLYAPMLLVTFRLVTSPGRLTTLLTVFLGSAAVVLLLGLLQWAFFADSMVLRFDPQRSIWIPRVSSVLAHPNNLGSYLLLLVPLSAALVLAPRLAYRRWLLALLVFTAGLASAYATYSRSAWIALAVSLAVGAMAAVVLRTPRLAGSVALGVAVAVSAAFALPNVRSLVASALDPAYESNRTRLLIFAGSLADLSNLGAVIGEGLGDTASLLKREAAISLYQIASASAREAQVAKARTFVDNGVVKTWIEQGVVGLVVAGWVAVRLLHASLVVARRSAEPEQRAVGLAACASLCGLAVLWLFLDVPDMFPVNLYFWTFAGLVSGLKAK